MLQMIDKFAFTSGGQPSSAPYIPLLSGSLGTSGAIVNLTIAPSPRNVSLILSASCEKSVASRKLKKITARPIWERTAGREELEANVELKEPTQELS